MAKQIKPAEVAAQPQPQAKNEDYFDLNAVKPKAVDLPLIPPNDPFFLCVHPDRWEIRYGTDGKPMLMPNFGILPFKLGVEGCDTETQADPAIARWKRRGWSVLDHKLKYLRKLPVVKGHAYITKFDHYFNGSAKTITDLAAMARWAESLVQAGEIPAPTLPALQTLLSEQRARLFSLAEKARVSSSKAVELERVKAAVELLEAKVNAMYSDLTPIDPEDLETVESL